MLVRVKYLGATDTQGKRLVASFTPVHSSRRRIIRGYNYGLDSIEQSKLTALEFIKEVEFLDGCTPEVVSVHNYSHDIDLVDIRFKD